MSAALPALCPRCRKPLFVGTASGVVVQACGTCGGVWLDAASARRVAEALPADALNLAENAAGFAKGAADLDAPAPCPVCAKLMQRSRVALANLEIDVCPAHGTWYDKSELQRFADALQSSPWRAGKAAAGGAKPPTAAPGPTCRTSSGGVEIAANVLGAVVVGLFESLFD